jgi:hypothetical protein
MELGQTTPAAASHGLGYLAIVPSGKGKGKGAVGAEEEEVLGFGGN